MTNRIYIAALLSVALISGCQKESVTEGDGTQTGGFDPKAGWEIASELENKVESFKAPEAPFEYTITYEYDKDEFCNPERGPYAPLEYHFKDVATKGFPKPYTLERLVSCKTTNCTLHYLGVYLCDYLESDIPQEALEILRTHFTLERQAGTKVILRHAYSWDNKWPVQEPELKWIKRHIEQLSPIWNEFKDVIYVFQGGFIGVYGEWHTLTNITKDAQKGELVKCYLDHTPKDRQIALRTPGHKRLVMKYINDGQYALADTITAATAFDGSYNSRLGNHNDCVLVNGNDAGTFGGTPDKKLLRTESNYVSVGGESCFVGDYTYCDCEYSNKHLRQYHWSYLSNHYAIVDYWKNNGCNKDLSTRIGYRFVFNGSSFFGKFTAGGDFLMKMCLTNYGFASLINERKIELILTNDADPSEKYVFVSDKDLRDWKGCHHYEWDEKLTLPETLKPGASYTLWLNLPDIAPNLHDNPAYSVRVASRGVWDETTGYNRIAAFKAE